MIIFCKAFSNKENRCLIFYLLRWNIISGSSHVNLLINIKTRNDEKYAWSSCSTFDQSSKSEYNCSFIFLKVWMLQLWDKFHRFVLIRLIFNGKLCLTHILSYLIDQNHINRKLCICEESWEAIIWPVVYYWN